MEPLSWGKGHADVISVQSMLKHYGFDVPEINMNAYMEARKLTQEFMDDFLGYFMDSNNRLMSSLLLGCGLPGGMMGSMMADLKGAMNAINNNREARGEAPYTEDELLVRLFDEVAYVWPRVGYPPLVTPFSQYVKNISLMNLLTESMGKPRFTMMDDNMWGMILGKSGRLPGKWMTSSSSWPRKKATSLPTLTRKPTIPTTSTASARRWKKTAGIWVPTRKNSTNSPCTRNSIATTRAA